MVASKSPSQNISSIVPGAAQTPIEIKDHIVLGSSQTPTVHQPRQGWSAGRRYCFGHQVALLHMVLQALSTIASL